MSGAVSSLWRLPTMNHILSSSGENAYQVSNIPTSFPTITTYHFFLAMWKGYGVRRLGSTILNQGKVGVLHDSSWRDNSSRPSNPVAVSGWPGRGCVLTLWSFFAAQSAHTLHCISGMRALKHLGYKPARCTTVWVWVSSYSCTMGHWTKLYCVDFYHLWTSVLSPPRSFIESSLFLLRIYMV